jgi:hypothetical protein
MSADRRNGIRRKSRTDGTGTRRRIATAVVAAATVSGLALTAVPAAADTASPVGIGHATTSAQEHGTFTVPVWSDDPADPVASVTAVIRDGDTQVGRPVALVRVATEGTETDLWRLPEDQPLKLTEDDGPMPHLGRYPIDITATDARGGTVDRSDAGTLDFTLRPGFAAGTVLPATVDYPHRDVTVKGRLFGLQPGSGDEVPLAGREVDLYQNPYGGGETYDPTVLHLTTDAGGAYSATVTVDDKVAFLARFGEDSAEAHGDPVGWTYPVFGSTAVTVTGAADRTRVLPGKTFVVSGWVRQGLSAPATAPALAGAPVVVTLKCGVFASDHEVHTVADAAGHYAVTVVADPECDGTWTAAGDSAFLDRQTRATGHVSFPDNSTVAVASSTIAANGTVTVTGHLLRTYHRTQTFAGQNTFLWYSRDGKTDWVRLKGANTDAGGAFRLVAPGWSDGYYQVRHTETDQLIASSGPVVRLTRITTRVVGETANSTRVRPNTVIRVSGTLRQYVSGAWRPYAWQHVHLYFQPKGSTAWTYKGIGTTNATGWVGYWPKVTGDGKWLIRYFGDARHFDSDTTPVYVEML